ncbi:MAG: hypothetical protein R3313_00245 [Candidatus Saccharimonadales bacterium]|nr:hypothetical protein [Candidatus Saccharimonadales bacterium]
MLIRSVGLSVGFVASIFWTFILLASLFSGDEAIEIEGIILSILVMGCVGSFLMIWKGRLKAVDVLIGFGLALCCFAVISAGRNHLFAVLTSGFPFLLSGLLIKYSVPSKDQSDSS